MRIIDLFNEVKDSEDDFILVKAYNDGKCVLHAYNCTKDEVSSTLDFNSELVIADNHDMKAQYIKINDQLFDQLRFDEKYSGVLIYLPRADAYGREVVDFEGPAKFAELFKYDPSVDLKEHRIYFVVISGKGQEIAKHILMS